MCGWTVSAQCRNLKNECGEKVFVHFGKIIDLAVAIIYVILATLENPGCY